jgi:DNA topoisomerase II
LRNLIQGKEMKEMIPWYNEFSGEIKPLGINFTSIGKYEIKGETILISELPIGKWTLGFRNILTSMLKNGKIESFKDNSKENNIQFTIELTIDQMKNLDFKEFQLSSEFSSSFELKTP